MTHDRKPPSGKALAALAIGAIGVVYGDIGTSPLYAMKEAFAGPLAVPLTKDNVLGLLSLIFWSLNILITYKYLSLMMQADNRGEGGVLALLALLKPGRLPPDAGGSSSGSASSGRPCCTATGSLRRRSRSWAQSRD